MIDESLVYIILVTVFVIFIINKQPKLVATLFLIMIIYYLYKRNFTHPKEFTTFIQNKVKEAFEPCSVSNMAYCNSDTNSSFGDTTFLPDIMRSAPPNNSINNINNVKLKLEDYTIDKRLNLGKEAITVDEMIRDIPLLLDYKMYLETLIKFVLSIKTDDTIQKDFLAKKLQNNMTKVFYNAYNTVNNKSYPINTYNELVYSQLQFNETLNIFTFLGLNEVINNKLLKFQKEFNTMNEKLNEYIIEKVNDVTPNDYDITTSFLPRKGEPMGVSTLDNDINVYDYKDL
jgi:hypothetical protein